MYNKKQNLAALFSDVQDYFSPKIVGEINEVYVKIAKIKGQDIPWHMHDDEDEMFYIVKGDMIMEVRNEKPVVLKTGDFFIVKHGVEHRVHSEEECWLMLIENKETKHTGNVVTEVTKSIEEQQYGDRS